MLEVKFRTEQTSWSTREVLQIVHKGEIIGEHFEGGEPEDNLFCRDYSWVAGAIEDAYKRGVTDGEDLANDRVRVGA